MQRYYEYFFLKSWQRLFAIGFLVFLFQIIRVAFLNPNNLSTSKLFIILLLFIFTIVFLSNKKKIIIDSEGITIESSIFGFSSKFFSWDKLSLFDKNNYIIIATKNQKTIIVPFFWDNKTKDNIVDIIHCFKFKYKESKYKKINYPL